MADVEAEDWMASIRESISVWPTLRWAVIDSSAGLGPADVGAEVYDSVWQSDGHESAKS